MPPERPVRVALVAPRDGPPGGQSVQAAALEGGLRAEGWDVVFVPTDPRFPPGLRGIRRVPYARTLLNEALYLARLRAALRGCRAALVFAAAYWSFVLSPLPAIVAARRRGARTIVVYHSGEADDHLDRWGRLVHPWLRRSDGIVVPSEYLRSGFLRHGYDARVIRNVVDTSRFRFRPRETLRPRLLSARTFERHYAVDNTLRAFASLRDEFPEATLTLAGLGGEEDRLRRLASSLGARGVRFVGAVPPEAMPALYDDADVFVNSSRVDNQPVSILEAFAAGLPVVSTTPGGVASMVRDGETGLAVPRDAPAAMTAAVSRLLRNPVLALEIAGRARSDVEAYTWPRVRAGWADALASRTA